MMTNKQQTKQRRHFSEDEIQDTKSHEAEELSELEDEELSPSDADDLA